jgi:hypothetical protein
MLVSLYSSCGVTHPLMWSWREWTSLTVRICCWLFPQRHCSTPAWSFPFRWTSRRGWTELTSSGSLGDATRDVRGPKSGG